MDIKEKLVEWINQGVEIYSDGYQRKLTAANTIADHLIAQGVMVQECIDSEEMLPQVPCLALDVNGNSAFIPDGILTIKDSHGERCIHASLAKEVSLVDGTKIYVLLLENRVAYWMPLPQPPKGE